MPDLIRSRTWKALLWTADPFRPFRFLDRVWRDHQAMQFIRVGRGDVLLESVVIGRTLAEMHLRPISAFACTLYQGRAFAQHEDPAEAILKARDEFRRKDHA